LGKFLVLEDFLSIYFDTVNILVGKMTASSPLADKMVLVSAKEFAKFSQNQKTLK